MRKILLILFVVLICSGQGIVPEDTIKVETPKLNTELGRIILETNKAEAKEAELMQKNDSAAIADRE